jgi:hypothetical protein
MIRIKTLSFPLISAMVVSTAVNASAQVALELSSQKSYRQNQKSLNFKGGSFVTRLSDGHVSSVGFCNDFNYYPPGYYILGPCTAGTSGYVTKGNVNGATIQRPYLVVTELVGAIIIQPYEPTLCKLVAAPASKLPRPSVGFQEQGATISYNLHVPTSIRDYNISSYSNTRKYSESQREKFQDEIVTGVYHYTFPRLGAPTQPAPVVAVIYPMVEGYAKLNNRAQGFEFTKINNNVWNKAGYIEMSFARPNTFKWSGLTPSSVYAAVDSVYFSLKPLTNPKKPQTSGIVAGEAIFPSFTTSADESAVLLPSPYTSSYTTPPIFPSGTQAMVQIEVQRNFQTGGVTYDFSNRKFQIPVMVIDRYTEYQDTYLAKAKNKDILADPDGDGFNNLTEWILNSDGNSAASVPPTLTPAAYQAEDFLGAATPIGSYYGFNVDVKQGTIPSVSYTLQRSLDQGKTWKKFKSDNDWSVVKVTTVVRGITKTQIQVRSLEPNPDAAATIPTIQPPGTIGDLYRIKLSLTK